MKSSDLPEFDFTHLLISPAYRNGELELDVAGSNSEISGIEKFLSGAFQFPGSSHAIYGHLSYDLKNRIEDLQTAHPDKVQFPLASFFIPESNRTIAASTLKRISETATTQRQLSLRARTPEKKYKEQVNHLKAHLHRGDIYEVNYCMEFFAEDVKVDPLHLFQRLNELTRAPHACLYKCGKTWLICASPERFLKKEGSKIISQPIKGTRPRGKTKQEDEQLISELKHDQKEISENVMIVDLVRNDLSKFAEKGSVHVDELCGIHTFESVHQMISTVSAEVNGNVSFEEIIRAAFPMGSMTGAPKIRAMQLIDEFEDMNRGIYSGSVGIIHPNGDFDLNVVIRSIEYNEKTGYLSVKVGSAITANCDPEKEYEECMVKARPMFEALKAVLDPSA